MENNENDGKNWYQILAITLLIIYIIAIIIIANEVELQIANIFLYIFLGIISFLFMYGFGTIINLLSQINTNLKNNQNNINPKKKINKEFTNNKNNDDLPWELRED